MGRACPHLIPRRAEFRDMSADSVGRPTGHVLRLERVRGPVWYAKYRLPDRRQGVTQLSQLACKLSLS
jgi:hypothetical protein